VNSPPPSATVFLVDDDPSVRRSLVRLLHSAGHQVEAFIAPGDLLAQVDLRAPGCLLLDLQLPGLNGLEFQDHLRAVGCPMPIVFITGQGDIPASVRAMKGGAVDFLTKPFRDADLLGAVASALAADQRQRRERAAIADIEQRLGTLTPRELEVLKHVLTGALNKQIADALGTVEKTIKVHRARVMEKMRVESVAELVLLAQRAGVPPASRVG
jgi:FixJ family two-component response regulator